MPKVMEAWADVMPRLASVIVDQIGQTVDAKLKTAAAAYKQGLSEPDSVVVTGLGFRVQLMTPASVALENGFDAFDMKAHMLRRAKKFTKKGDPYVDVKFRHGASPNTIRLKGMSPEAAKQVRSAVGKEKRLAKKYGREFAASLRVTGKFPAASGTKHLRFGQIKQAVKFEHKTGIYSDMLAETFKRGKATARTYSTIRRISRNSQATAWWHPGFRGLHAMPPIQKNVHRVAKKLLILELAKIGIRAK